MLIIWLLLALVLAICFAGVFVGAPYLPTLNKQIEAALDLVNLKEGQTLIELGCGDGRVLVAAAKRGIKSYGYELNPVLVIAARFRTRKYKSYTKVIWANYWRVTWPPADAVFVFLIGRYMAKLDKHLEGYQHKPVKLASFAFKIPDKKIAKQKAGVYLYDYKKA